MRGTTPLTVVAAALLALTGCSGGSDGSGGSGGNSTASNTAAPAATPPADAETIAECVDSVMSVATADWPQKPSGPRPSGCESLSETDYGYAYTSALARNDKLASDALEEALENGGVPSDETEVPEIPLATP